MKDIKLLGKIMWRLLLTNYIYNKHNNSWILYGNPIIRINVDKKKPGIGKPESSRHRAFINSGLDAYANMKGESK